jgi:hypothetical protein
MFYLCVCMSVDPYIPKGKGRKRGGTDSTDTLTTLTSDRGDMSSLGDNCLGTDGTSQARTDCHSERFFWGVNQQ